MKKRILMVVPVLALLAGCGQSDPLDAVRKTLPDDVEYADPAKVDKGVIDEYINDAFKEVLNISEDRSVYHLAVDFSLSTSVTVENVIYGGSARVKGDLYLGFETVVKEQEAYSSLFLKLENFSVYSQLNLPESVKEKIPLTDDFTFNDLDLFMYASEFEGGSGAYFDLSNHELQDYVKSVLLTNQMDPIEIESTLTSLLGEKIEGSEYRPGLSYIDTTSLLKTINDARVAEGAESISEDEMLHPITAILYFARDMISNIEGNIQEFVSEFLPMVSPVVGVKYVEVGPSLDGLEKTSIAINVSTAQIAASLEIPSEYMPINGVAGLLFSVGMEKGSEDYALEEISLSANLSGTIEETSFSFNGSISLSASYNDQAVMEELSEEDISEYSDVSSYVSSLIISLM